MVGDQVIVIGAPYGLSHSLSVGWISARWAPNTVYRSMPLAEFFQTTATIKHRELGRAHVQYGGRGHRDRESQHLEVGRERRARLRRDDQHGRMLLLQRRSFWSGARGSDGVGRPGRDPQRATARRLSGQDGRQRLAGVEHGAPGRRQDRDGSTDNRWSWAAISSSRSRACRWERPRTTIGSATILTRKRGARPSP